MMSNILFAIESISRELDYKLLLACMLLTKDRVVYIGQHDYSFFMSKYMNGGVYLGKNLFSTKKDGSWQNRHCILKGRGIIGVHLDEEGAIYEGNESMWRKRLNRRVDIDAIEEDDYMCTWGDFQKRHYHQNTKISFDNIITTGHPRFEMPKKKYQWYYHDDVSKIKSKYGDFVLVPTAFGWFNNSKGPAEVLSKRWNFSLDEKGWLNQIHTWGNSGKTFCSYIELIAHISKKFSKVNFVIRPHPAEDAMVYKYAFSDVKNVYIIRKGGIMPWILSSKLIIMSACTTAIEGYLSNTPVLNFQPFEQPQHESLIPSAVSIKCTSVNEVVEHLDKFLIHDSNISTHSVIKNKAVLDLFYNLENKEDSFEKILNIIDKIDVTREKSKPDTFNQILFYGFRIRYAVKLGIKKIIRPFFVDKQNKYLADRSIFPGFDEKYINNKVSMIEKVLGKEVHLKYVNSELIVLTQS